MLTGWRIDLDQKIGQAKELVALARSTPPLYICQPYSFLHISS